jgi:hypothetical protein
MGPQGCPGIQGNPGQQGQQGQQGIPGVCPPCPTPILAYGQVFKNIDQTLPIASSVRWDNIQNNLNITQAGTAVTVQVSGIYQIHFYIASQLVSP